MIDSHSHIYADDFIDDLPEMIARAQAAGVSKILMPNIDSSSLEALYKVHDAYPDLALLMMGLHPCSVQEGYKEELQRIEKELDSGREFIAIGEIGVDLYWDKTTQKIQEEAFLIQCEWAIQRDLPIVIHSRESIDLIIDLVDTHYKGKIEGVFHCFTGTVDQAKRIEDLGMYMGIGGVVTFKNTHLREVLPHMDINRVLIETDAPYLAPTPYRGKRNEPSYVKMVQTQIAESLGMDIAELDKKIESNTKALFKI